MNTLNIVLWRYYATFFKGKTLVLSSALAAALLQALIMLPIATIIGYMLDVVIPSRDLLLLVRMGISIVLLYGLNLSLGLWTRYIALKTTRAVMIQIRAELVAKLYSVSRAYYTQADRTSWQTLLIQDVNRTVDKMSVDLLARIVPSLLVSGVVSLILIAISPLIAALLFGIVFLLVIATSLTGRLLRKWVTVYHRAFDRFNAGVDFVLRHMDLTRQKAIEDWERQRRVIEFESLGTAFQYFSWFISLQSMTQDLIIFILSLVVLIVGGLEVGAGRMTIGNLLTVFVLINILRAHFKLIVGIVPNSVEGIAALERIYRLMQAPYPRPYSGQRAIRFNGRITISDVSFNYGEVGVLLGLTMSVQPGQTVALVGRNGSGKSTIANLVLGFYKPTHGKLQADGIDYAQLDIRSLRRQIGAVSQNPLIFSGTIWENITYGHPNVGAKQVYESASLATALEFIERQPLGFETLIGDDGVLLSGGQRQRLALTRALLGNPSLLILDEPTSHLDNSSMRRLMHNLREHFSHLTILTLTHDASVVEQTDRVHVLESGRIVASGDHFSLMSQNTFYRDLFRLAYD